MVKASWSDDGDGSDNGTSRKIDSRLAEFDGVLAHFNQHTDPNPNFKTPYLSVFLFVLSALFIYLTFTKLYYCSHFWRAWIDEAKTSVNCQNVLHFGRLQTVIMCYGIDLLGTLDEAI